MAAFHSPLLISWINWSASNLFVQMSICVVYRSWSYVLYYYWKIPEHWSSIENEEPIRCHFFMLLGANIGYSPFWDLLRVLENLNVIKILEDNWPSHQSHSSLLVMTFDSIKCEYGNNIHFWYDFYNMNSEFIPYCENKQGEAWTMKEGRC